MKKIIPLLLASSVLIAGCNEKQSPSSYSAPAIKKEDAVAEVNGTYISKKTFDTLNAEITQRSHGQKFPKAQLLEELIQRELLYQEAVQKNLGQSSEVAERIKMATQSLLTQAAIQDYLKTNPVSDEVIKAEYDKEMTKVSGQEYKARHILVKTEDEAKKLIEELKGGADFVELAKKKSTGPSASQGGDLGWFVEGQMVEVFSKAVIGLEDNKFTQEPIKSQFGYHVILREGARAQTPPPFEAVKEQLRPSLEQQKIKTMLEGLRKKASVTILIDTKEAATDAAKPTDATAPVIPKPVTDNKAVEEQAKKLDAAESSEKTDDKTTEETSKTDEPATKKDDTSKVDESTEKPAKDETQSETSKTDDSTKKVEEPAKEETAKVEESAEKKAE